MPLFMGLMILVVLPAIIATVIASILTYRRPDMPRRRRVQFAAFPAGLIPVTPGLISVWRMYHASSLVPLAAVFTLGLIIALLVGTPAALHATRPRL